MCFDDSFLTGPDARCVIFFSWIRTHCFDRPPPRDVCCVEKPIFFGSEGNKHTPEFFLGRKDTPEFFCLFDFLTKIIFLDAHAIQPPNICLFVIKNRLNDGQCNNFRKVACSV
jgi:hypothetical protein